MLGAYPGWDQLSDDRLTAQEALLRFGWVSFYSTQPETLGLVETNESTYAIASGTQLQLIAETTKEECNALHRLAGWQPITDPEFRYFYRAVAE